jgi:hypothetical protein
MSVRGFKMEATCTVLLFIFLGPLIDTADLRWSTYLGFRTAVCRSLLPGVWLCAKALTYV